MCWRVQKPLLSHFFFFSSNLFITRAIAVGSADRCHARHTIRCDGVSPIVWKWQGCTQRRFRCRGSSVMIVLAHGILSSHSNPSKYLCTLIMALEPPLNLALSTKSSCASFPLTSARYGVVFCTVNVRSRIITKIVVSNDLPRTLCNRFVPFGVVVNLGYFFRGVVDDIERRCLFRMTMTLSSVY